MCIGDFNAILNSTKKLSKRPPDHYQMDAFQEALDNCQLEDLGFGVINMHGIINGLVMRTLDRDWTEPRQLQIGE